MDGLFEPNILTVLAWIFFKSYFNYWISSIHSEDLFETYELYK